MITVDRAEHERSLRTIAAHFAAGTSSEAESAMRSHMPGCSECREVYQGYLILGQLDPTALPARERIGRALNLRPPLRRQRLWWLAMAIPAAAAVLMLAWPAPGPPRAPQTAGTFSVRGRELAGGPAPRVWVYRLGAQNQPRLVDGQVSRDDELAFAYANPAGKPYLMIFGVDDDRKVYWFHPAWPKGAPAPAAVPALAGQGPHELPEAIRHDLAGGRLQLYAVFSDVRLDANAIERRLQATPGRLEMPESEGSVVQQRLLEVRR